MLLDVAKAWQLAEPEQKKLVVGVTSFGRLALNLALAWRCWLLAGKAV